MDRSIAANYCGCGFLRWLFQPLFSIHSVATVTLLRELGSSATPRRSLGFLMMAESMGIGNRGPATRSAALWHHTKQSQASSLPTCRLVRRQPRLSCNHFQRRYNGTPPFSLRHGDERGTRLPPSPHHDDREGSYTPTIPLVCQQSLQSPAFPILPSVSNDETAVPVLPRYCRVTLTTFNLPTAAAHTSPIDEWHEGSGWGFWPYRLKVIATLCKHDSIILGVDILNGYWRIGTPLAVVKTDSATGKEDIIPLGKMSVLILSLSYCLFTDLSEHH